MGRPVWLATALLACGHPAPPPVAPAPVHTPDAAPAPHDAAPAPDAPPLADDPPRLATRAVQLYADWRRALDAAGTSCATAAASLNALADRYADVIAANTQVVHEGGAKLDALRAALAAHQAELDAAAAAIMHSPTMAACHADPAFAKALDRLGGSS